MIIYRGFILNEARAAEVGPSFAALAKRLNVEIGVDAIEENELHGGVNPAWRELGNMPMAFFFPDPKGRHSWLYEFADSECWQDAEGNIYVEDPYA